MNLFFFCLRTGFGEAWLLDGQTSLIHFMKFVCPPDVLLEATDQICVDGHSTDRRMGYVQ